MQLSHDDRDPAAASRSYAFGLERSHNSSDRRDREMLLVMTRLQQGVVLAHEMIAFRGPFNDAEKTHSLLSPGLWYSSIQL